MSIEFTKYLTKPIIGAIGIGIYNMVFSGHTIKSPVLYKDTLIFGWSILVSKLFHDLLFDVIKIENNYIYDYLVEAVTNSLVYAYGYEKLMGSTYGYGNSRWFNENMIIGGVG